MTSLLFLNPWLLSALATLPALWFLLRIMPPAPRQIFLPSARFLEGLVPKTKTPSKTPWWILLLRLIVVTLMITAFAQPVLNPSRNLASNNPIRIVIDNGWSSAHIWERKIQAVEDVLARAVRQGLSVYLDTTAPEPSDGKPLTLGPLSAHEALSRLKGLQPYPWSSDFKARYEKIKESPDNVDTYYFSDGIQAKSTNSFIKTLKQKGQVHIFKPSPENLPLILSKDNSPDRDLSFFIHAPETIPAGTPVTLEALGAAGQVIGVESVTLKGKKTQITMEIPESLRQNLAHVRIAGHNNAASIYLFDDQFQKKRVGIASPAQADQANPFIEASFYLTRALEPYAELQVGNIDALLGNAVIILPDIGALSPQELEKLDVWVRDGGLLLRFAGPVMEQARQHFLTPTPLRKGARSLDGALAWETPPKLQSFNKNAPLAGIALREDIIIKQQLLAEPVQDLADKTWAVLDDGTPLITADRLDSGLIVLVHTTASPDWSNLPLSGAFVQILSRLVKIAGSNPDSLQNITGSLEALRTLNGKGRLIQPEASVQPIMADQIATTKISYKHPPGIYGNGSIRYAFNFADQIPSVKALGDMSNDITILSYDTSHEQSLMPALLLTSFILLLMDWIIMIAMSSSMRLNIFKRAAVMVFLCFILPAHSHAQTPDSYKYADGLYLGFIKSANTGLNAQTRRGLEALKDALTARTSAEPDGVASLNPETDILSFFPFIYWPIDANDQPLSQKALRNVQDYLDHGGTILFDTRTQDTSTKNNETLMRITAGLNIPALSPIKDDHVLGKSFYLLDSFPGRYNGGTIWVESNSENGRDGVSSVLIGSHDWASAWAQSAGRNYRSGASARQRELSIRFGINLMMYALTGNYKADQVHVKHILERLGQ